MAEQKQTQSPEMQMLTQLLANEITERATEEAEHEGQIADLTARLTACEASERDCRERMVKAEASLAAAAGALETERAAKMESERRCTFLTMELAKPDVEEGAPQYKFVFQKDGNGSIVSATAKPVAD